MHIQHEYLFHSHHERTEGKPEMKSRFISSQEKETTQFYISFYTYNRPTSIKAEHVVIPGKSPITIALQVICPDKPCPGRHVGSSESLRNHDGDAEQNVD